MTLLTVTLEHYLVVSALLLVTGLVGIAIGRKSIITILMSLELMLLSVNINLVAFSAHLKDITGQAMGLFVLTVAAAEAAIGLAILLTCYRNRGTVDIEDLSTLKG